MTLTDRRITLAALFISAYLTALLVFPTFDAHNGYPQFARLLLVLCGLLCLGTGGAFLASFAPAGEPEEVAEVEPEPLYYAAPQAVALEYGLVAA